MRPWFFIASAFLIVSGCAHLAGHCLAYIFEKRYSGSRQGLADAMKAFITDKILWETSMWTLLQAYSLSLTLLLLLGGATGLFLLFSGASDTVIYKAAIFNSVFWLFALLLYTFLARAVQTVAITSCSAVLYMIALAI